MNSTAVANLASQVGAVRSVGNAYLRLRLPLRVCWFTYETVATHRVERSRSYSLREVGIR